MYTYEEAYQKSLDYFNGDSLAAKVWLDKYALRDNDGNILEDEPSKMHRRLAKELHRIESKYPNPLTEEEIFQYLDRFGQIIPQGSPMSGIGNKHQIMSLSNCEVIASPEDSYGGILYTDQEQVQLMKRRCGVGFDISTLRPKGIAVKNAARTTDGIGVFMERFSNSCREVAQNSRRGALLLSISVHHPEIETFIDIKRNLNKVTGANLSIKLTDDFMNSVKDNTEYEQKWPVDSNNPNIIKKVKAKHIWDKIIESAWSSAEPCILYWDTVEKYTPAEVYKDLGFKHISCNPCAELVLSAYDSCRLLLINVSSCVINEFTNNVSFDFKKLHNIAYVGQKLMDDIIDLEMEHIDSIINKIKSDPEPDYVKTIELDLWYKIKNNCFNGRRTGLGITALGDSIAGMNMIYGDVESVEFTEKVYKTICLASYRCSVDIAMDRGSFPIFDFELEKNHPFLDRIWQADNKLYEDYKKYGRRQIANLTTPPSGSTSILCRLFSSKYHNTTSGIEPAYLLFYKRRKKINPNDKTCHIDFIDNIGDKWQEYIVYHSGFSRWKDVTNKTDNDKEQSPYFESTSNNINWEDSVYIQSVAQKWVCHSISKTCNLPNNASKELVSNVYMKAWEQKCKGFSVYRDGCRSGVLVENKPQIPKTNAPKRPVTLNVDIHFTNFGENKFQIIVGLLGQDPYEIFVANSEILASIKPHPKVGFVTKIKRGIYQLFVDDKVVDENIAGYVNQDEEAICRLVSTSLRHGSDLSFIVHQLEKTKGNLLTFSKAISRILKKYIKDGTTISGESCPQCHQDTLERSGGCPTCKSCGYSVCT